MKFAILKNENEESPKFWKLACEKYRQVFLIVDILDSSWLDQISSEHFDGFLACPSGTETLYKKMYDERIYILDKVLGKFVYPSYDEISLHENKKYLSYWLDAEKLPHPKTLIFYKHNEAAMFAKECTYPIVGKINIGASGKGVQVFHDRASLIRYIDKAFSDGLRQNWGPNLKMGGYGKRIQRMLSNPLLIFQRLKEYKKLYNEIQKDFIILQEFISHSYEWRIVRIGDSYFGHQKVKVGEKASGTKGIDYIAPPEKLLSFVKDICDKYGFNCMAIDLFEDGKGSYLINEMQCIFGHVQTYICEYDGNPGRFINKSNNWIFEAGMYNTNLSYDLRLENVISILQRKPE